MHSRIPSVVLPPEIGDFVEDLRAVFAELGRGWAVETLAGECSPALDVYETDETLEVRMDLPGVQVATVRVIIKRDQVLIAGHKAARRARGDSSFHLVERGFGRFARTVRLSAACDGRRARATLAEGELRITIPKITERRGRAIPISVQPGSGKQSS